MYLNGVGEFIGVKKQTPKKEKKKILYHLQLHSFLNKGMKKKDSFTLKNQAMKMAVIEEFFST